MTLILTSVCRSHFAWHIHCFAFLNELHAALENDCHVKADESYIILCACKHKENVGFDINC